MSRKIIQITGDIENGIVALCDDGTIWYRFFSYAWEQCATDTIEGVALQPATAKGMQAQKDAPATV